MGESIFNKKLAALKEEIHHLKEKAYSPQVPKCEVCHDTTHNTLSCSSRLETVHSVVGMPHQVLDTAPQMPITSISKPLEDMIKLFMQTSINLNESLTKVSQGILQEKEERVRSIQGIEQKIDFMTQTFMEKIDGSPKGGGCCHPKKWEEVWSKGREPRTRHRLLRRPPRA